MNLADIEKIVKILKQSDIHEFELEQDGTKIKLTRGNPTTAAQQAPHVVYREIVEPAISSAQVASSANDKSTSPQQQAEDSKVALGETAVKSPLVGTFYRKPSPDAEPFAKEGTQVKKGDTLCIVEAMKLMNEIEAPVSGTLLKVFVQEGEVVEFGEILFSIKPD